MKKELLIVALAAMFVTSNASAWSLFGSKDEKPNYDYSADQEVMDNLSQYRTIKGSLEDARRVCVDKGNDLGCLMAKKLEALMSKDIKNVVKFYEETVPEYCYDKKFAPACNIAAIDMYKHKYSYNSRKSGKAFDYKDSLLDFAKNVTASKTDLKMLEYGCDTLKSAYICRDLRDIYKSLGDLDKAKSYTDKMKSGDEKWRSSRFDKENMYYEYKYASGWFYLKENLN